MTGVGTSLLIIGTVIGASGLIAKFFRRQAIEEALTDELFPHEDWSAIPPNDAIRLQESKFEVWTWSRAQTQRVVEKDGDSTYERDEFIGSHVSVAVRCPEQPTQGLLAPVDAYLSRTALYRFGLLWLEKPASNIDVTTTQLAARLVGAALCRIHGSEALVELCQRARPGQPGSYFLMAPLLALELDHESLTTLASQWAVGGVFRTLIGTGRHHDPMMASVAMRVLDASDNERHELLLALLHNGQPMLLQVVIDALSRWHEDRNSLRPEDIVECSRYVRQTESVRLLCHIASLLSGSRAKHALSRLVETTHPWLLECALEELARLDIDTAVRLLLERLNAEEDDQAVLTVLLSALGKYAGVDAVMRIRRLTDGLMIHGDIKDAAKDAIAQIQSRAQAEAGRISLAASTMGGDVSISRNTD